MKDNHEIIYIDVLVASVELKITNKEVKELMGFLDRFSHYHEELKDQVLKELMQIKFETQMKKNVSKKQKNHTSLK